MFDGVAQEKTGRIKFRTVLFLDTIFDEIKIVRDFLQVTYVDMSYEIYSPKPFWRFAVGL